MPVSNALVVRALAVLLLAGLGVIAAPEAARAQHQPAALPPAWDAGALTEPSVYAVRVDAPRRDYRWLGTAVGALGLGLAAGLEAAAACGNSERGPRDCTGVTIGVGALGAVAGGTLGHFIGRLFTRG